MKENRDKAIGWVIKQEVNPGEEMTGSYHCEPGDRGGCTKFGIAEKYHPGVDIKNLTREGAIRIYEEEYWSKIDGDSLPAGLDLLVLDFAVTSSPHRALEILNNEPLMQLSNVTLISVYAQARRNYYESIAAKDPTQMKFLHDWLRRVDLAEAEAKKWEA